MVCSDLPGFSTSVASNEPLELFKLKTRIVYSCFFESEKNDRVVFIEVSKSNWFALLCYTIGIKKGATFSSNQK